MNTRDDDKLWDIRQTAGMVFQNPDNQMVATIVEDDVAWRKTWLFPGKIRKRVDQALLSVNMTEFAKSAPIIFRRSEAANSYCRNNSPCALKS